MEDKDKTTIENPNKALEETVPNFGLEDSYTYSYSTLDVVEDTVLAEQVEKDLEAKDVSISSIIAETL